MPALAMALVLASCALHALWNVYFKQARSSMAFNAVFLPLTSLLYLPAAVLLWPRGGLPAGAWLCVGATGFLYCCYFVGLAGAYESGELTLAYPMIRGVGPALTVVWGLGLLHERATIDGLVGVALICVGVAVLHWRRSTAALSTIDLKAFFFSLFVGVVASMYSPIDKIAVGHLHVAPVVYLFLTYTVCAVGTGPLAYHWAGREAVRAEWRTNRSKCLVVAAINPFAYLLVLFALSLPGAPVSYVVPLRSMGVLFGLAFGVRFLGEKSTAPKVAGVMLIVLGCILVAWKG